LQKRQRVTSTWQSDYLELSLLQTQLSNYPDALRNIDSAIESAPWQINLLNQRRRIEEAAGVDQKRVAMHFGQALRASADYEVRTGSDALGLQRYLLAFLQISGLQNTDDDATYELQTTVRGLSSFVSANYQQEDALRFWQSLARDPLLTSSQQQLAKQEATRLAKPH
jgi:hypothetical protein